MKLTAEQLDRMEGLTNIAAQESIETAADKIYTDLIEDGFDREDILEYFNHIIRGACMPA